MAAAAASTVIAAGRQVSKHSQLVAIFCTLRMKPNVLLVLGIDRFLPFELWAIFFIYFTFCVLFTFMSLQ